jgi:hypothetical protein
MQTGTTHRRRVIITSKPQAVKCGHERRSRASGRGTIDKMLFGHNTDVTVGEKRYHVQTEDRGTRHALIDTMVYCDGRVLHRRTNSYGDLLPLDARAEEKLRLRVAHQHQEVVKELRSGTLELTDGVGAKPSGNATARKPSAHTPVAAQIKGIELELTNGSSWLSGRRATLQVAVRDKDTGVAISGAHVIARVEGATDAAEFSTATGTQGQARLAFDMPHLAGGDAALVIEASHEQARGQLRFQLRAKPRVPAAG